MISEAAQTMIDAGEAGFEVAFRIHKFDERVWNPPVQIHSVDLDSLDDAKKIAKMYADYLCAHEWMIDRQESRDNWDDEYESNDVAGTIHLKKVYGDCSRSCCRGKRDTMEIYWGVNDMTP